MIRAALATAALAACTVDPLDVTGLPCPCPSGWTCDPATETCARVAADAPGGGDGGADAPIDLVTGLAYHFQLDEGMGQVIGDSSAPAQPGWAFYVGTHSTWTTGVVGGGMHFDGTLYQAYGMYPTTGSTCDGIDPITSSFTASAWVMFDSFRTSDYTLSDIAAMHGTAGGSDGGWGIGAGDGCGVTTAGLTITAPDGVTRVNRCGRTPLTTGSWYHIAGVYDASARKLDIYLNGVEDTGGLAPGSPGVPDSMAAPTMSRCAYLAASANQGKLLVGTLDEFRLYTRALSAAEIAELYRVSQ